MFQNDRHLKDFREFCYFKKVPFVEITRQMFCSHAVAFPFKKATKFDFLL